MAGLAAMAAAVLLTALRMPVALALMLAAGAGLAWSGSLDRAWPPVAALLSAPDLLLVPLVLMLGNTAFYAGFATRVHDAAAVILQERRGGLALAAIGGCAGFAATSGSSLGCAATMSRIAIPPMLRAGHDPGLAGASVAMGSTLGALLPPSMLLIVWGLLSGTPVGAMFLAGLLPALLSLAGMVAVVLWWVWRDPQAAPLPQPLAITPTAALRAVWPAPVLFAILVGGIHYGSLTPVAAVAICLALTLAFGLVQHRLTPEALWLALRETLEQTARIVLLLIAARLFLSFLDTTGIPASLADWAAESLPRLAVLALLGLTCMALGLVAEPVAMLVLLMPFVLALAESWGLDAVWAGIVLVKLVEIALILPPYGLIVTVVATAIRTIPSGTILAGVARFLFADLLVLAALALFPALASWP
ncbi:TRAP transporter large permease subunit [Paracoccus benzoatiresistens]|uniref:TRAP transporter large permease subunit n=1 Tax=Paracoccus benzoatiresistens TaxID=2997341 RepID=A0ABT4J286_9RHOB|nr:TRAP transporter large permease subunit [Paracoccus sp. EF6]MCZ0960518.1 TRAP transporter large permease subunit [Paracoccus sp. EF6]